jgi:hypothetical protein
MISFFGAARRNVKSDPRAENAESLMAQPRSITAMEIMVCGVQLKREGERLDGYGQRKGEGAGYVRQRKA